MAWIRPPRPQGRKRHCHLCADHLQAQSRRDHPQQDGSSTVEPISQLVGFRSTYVFDIAQTDGQDLPEFATVKGNPAQHLERLKTLTVSHSITLDYDASIAPAKGVSRGGRITLMPNMPAAEEFSTLVHELSHEKLHRTDRRAETTKTIRETEAEAVAFVVCHAIGLDTNTAAADSIKLYNGDRATLSVPSVHSVHCRRDPHCS